MHSFTPVQSILSFMFAFIRLADAFIQNDITVDTGKSMPSNSFVVAFGFQVTLPEHSPPGSPVITVTATDRDSGENGKVTYRVLSSTRDGFYIDPKNGIMPSVYTKYVVLSVAFTHLYSIYMTCK